MINWEEGKIKFYSCTWELEDFRAWVVKNYPVVMQEHLVKAEATGGQGLKTRYDWRSIANNQLVKLFIMQNIDKGISLAETLKD